MKYNPEKHHRRSIRLPEYDYSKPGGYYITIVTQNRECLFGDVVDGKMILNDFGRFVQKCWMEIPVIYPHVTLDKFVIMPNHIHGILMIIKNNESVGAIHESPLHESPQRNSPLQRRKMTLPKIIGRFKMNTAKYINKMRNSPGIPVWQRNYWEHVIRDDNDLNRIREYIINNPLQWAMDSENPELNERTDLKNKNGKQHGKN